MSKVFDSAVRLLSRREHGAIELCDKLVRKGFSREEANKALQACQELDLQNDNRFIESYTNSRVRQGYGPLKIMQELKGKGLEPDLIQKVLHQEQYDWLQHALRVWQKKSRGEQEMSFDEKQKQQRFLLYRGFSRDTIAEVLREI